MNGVSPVRLAWAVIAGALVALCLGFAPEVGAAVTTWNASTAYGHCWLVLPIVGWLLWERRAVVQAGTPRPWVWPALAAVPLVLAWLVADVLGIMEGRQLALIGFAELLLMAALGLRFWWSLSAAFLYLVFLVPFGAFLTPALQRFTTGFILGGLRLLQVPFEADAFQITIPEGVFYVAEACAGLRFLIAAVAFGVLYAVTMFRSPWRRAIFIAVSCVVPVVANGFRGLGIVLLGHVLGSAEAGAADHLIYGWVFFSFVIIMLALSGLPFRQDHPVAAASLPIARAPAPRVRGVMLACVAVLAVAYAAPVGAALLDRAARGDVAAVVPVIVAPAGCRAADPKIDGAISIQTLQCGGARFRVQATALPAGTNPSRVLDAARDPAMAYLAGEVDLDGGTMRLKSGDQWNTLAAHDSGKRSAFAIVLHHRLAADGLSDRVAMARDMLARAPAPLVVTIGLTSPDADIDGEMRGFLEAQTGLAR